MFNIGITISPPIAQIFTDIISYSDQIYLQRKYYITLRMIPCFKSLTLKFINKPNFLSASFR